MKIAFTSKGKTWDAEIDPRFGRCPFFVIYDTEKQELTVVDNQEASAEAHGAGPKAAQRLAQQNCQVLVTGNGPGDNAASVLAKVNTEIYVGAVNMTVKQAYEAFKNGELKKFI